MRTPCPSSPSAPGSSTRPACSTRTAGPSAPTSATSTTRTPAPTSNRRWRPCSREPQGQCAPSPTTCIRTSTPPASRSPPPRAWACRRSACSTTTPTSARCWPSTSASTPARCLVWRSTASASAATARPGGASCCSWQAGSSSASAACARCACPVATAPRANPGAWRQRYCTPADAAPRSPPASPSTRPRRCSRRSSNARR